MLTIAVLILGFLLSFGTALISFRDKRQDFEDGKLTSKSFRAIFAFAVIGALMTLITNINSSYEKSQSNLKAQKLTDSLLSLHSSLSKSQARNLSLLIEQRDSTSQILSLQQNLIDANNHLNKANLKVIGLQNSLSENIIGTGNMPRFSISRASGDKYYRNLSIMIRNVGKSPLRGLRASITDIYSNIIFNPTSKQYESTTAKDSAVLLGHVLDLERQIQIGDLPSNSGKTFYYPRLARFVNEFGLRVLVTWDNGYVHFGFSGSFHGPDEKMDLKLDFITDNKNKQLSPELVEFTTFNKQ